MFGKKKKKKVSEHTHEILKEEKRRIMAETLENMKKLREQIDGKNLLLESA